VPAHDQTGLRFISVLIVILLATLASANSKIAAPAATQSSQKRKLPLEQFFVVTQAVFHNAPKWVDHILDVRPESGGVLVREIRIAPLSSACPRNVTVRAVERALPDTTVQRITAKFPICSYEEDDVEGMINVAKFAGVVSSTDDSASQTIVATCGTKHRMFELPDQDTLRFDALRHADSHVADFWDLAAAMEDRAFGEDFSLAKVTPEDDRKFQALGAKVVSDIKSGRYDQGFPDQSCPYAECEAHDAASALQGYTGPIFACPKK
jgi:hypothetical protein